MATFDSSFCVLIRRQGTGETLFWHRSNDQGYWEEAVQLWGKPVGSVFETYGEVWWLLPRVSLLFYPHANILEFQQLIKEFAADKVPVPKQPK